MIKFSPTDKEFRGWNYESLQISNVGSFLLSEAESIYLDSEDALSLASWCVDGEIVNRRWLVQCVGTNILFDGEPYYNAGRILEECGL